MAEQAEYVDDVTMPGALHVELDGESLVVYPKKFAVEDEIKVRKAFGEEDRISEERKGNVWEWTAAMRQVILDIGKEVLPHCVEGVTEENVGTKFQVTQISALLGFFLRMDSTSGIQVPGIDPIPDLSELSIPTTQEPPKPNRKARRAQR